MIGGRMRNFPVNVQINDVAVGGNNFTPVGSFSQGYPLLPILDLTQRVLEVPAGANITTNEVGPVHPRRHLHVQRLGAEGAAAQLHRADRVRREPPERHGAEPEPQLQPDRRRQRQPAVQPARPRRRVQDDGAGQRGASARPRPVRLAAGERQPPDDQRASR